MQRVVVDTSVIVKWLNQENESSIKQADKILADSELGKIQLYAPELAKYELGNVLLYGKQLTLKEANLALEAAYALPITFVPESKQMARTTYALARKMGITYYDAAFLTLTQEHQALLITENTKHQNEASGIQVLALKNY